MITERQGADQVPVSPEASALQRCMDGVWAPTKVEAIRRKVIKLAQGKTEGLRSPKRLGFLWVVGPDGKAALVAHRHHVSQYDVILSRNGEDGGPIRGTFEFTAEGRRELQVVVQGPDTVYLKVVDPGTFSARTKNTTKPIRKQRRLETEILPAGHYRVNCTESRLRLTRPNGRPVATFKRRALS